MATYNIYVVGDASHPAGFPMDKNVASHIPTNCDLLVYVGDVYPQGLRYCFEVGTNNTTNTRVGGFDFSFGERSGHNLVPKMCMIPGNHEYEDAPEAAGPIPSGAVGGTHSGDLSTLLPVGHEYYWTRPAGTHTLQADGTVGSYTTVNSNVYPTGSKTPINNTAFNGGTTPATYNGVTQGRHDCYFDIGGVRFVMIDDSQYTGSIPSGSGGGGGDEAFMPLANGTAAQQARWNKLTGWVDGAVGNACIVFAHRTRYPTGDANGNHKPSALLGPFHAYCTGRIIAWVHGHWHNASRTVPIKAGSNPTSLSAAANTSAFTGSGTASSPRVITNNDGFPIFCQGNGGNSLNGFNQTYLSLGQVPTAMREYGDNTNYGYMHISFDTNAKITFDQYNCGSSASGATTTNNLAASVTYQTTATSGPPSTPQPPVFTQTPNDPDTDTTPTFAWTAADSLTNSYQWKVDGAAWPGTSTSATTVTTSALSASAAPGTSHTFYVRAVAADGTTVSSPSSYTWHLTTTTTSAPVSFASSIGSTGTTTTSTSVTFTWASGGADDVTYQWSLDGGAWTSNGASTTKSFASVGTGSHTFQVRALNASSVPSSAVPSTPYAWTVNTTPPPSGKILFGQSHVVGGPPVAFDRTTLTNAEGALGRQIMLAHTIYNWGDNPPTVSTSDEKWLLDRGSYPIINCLGRLNPTAAGQDFPNFNTSGLANDTGMTDIANGVYDAHIKAWAQFSKDLGSTHFCRIWREMTNGAGACVWKTSTGPIWIAAWKRLYTIYKATSYSDYNTNVNPAHPISGSPINASNALMVWCPAIWGGVWDTWYPGDAYVDWNATDGYSYDTTATASNSNGPQGGWHSFHDIFINWYNQFNPQNGTKSRKPIMIAEVNAEPSTNTAHNRAAWWSAAETSINNDFPLVSAAVTWVDGQFPDFGVAGSSEYISYATDPIMGATTIGGTGGGGGDVIVLTVSQPPGNITVTDPAYTLSGSVSGGAGLALTINGSAVTINTGTDNSFTDAFTRTTSGGFGGTWTADGGASFQSTNGSAGVFTGVTAGGASRAKAGKAIADADIYMSHVLDTLPTGGAYQHHILFRYQDTNNGYHFMVWQDATAGSPVKAVFNREVSGTTTAVTGSSATVVAAGSAAAGTTIWKRVKYVGNHLQAKVWTGSKSSEPGGVGSDTNWDIDVTDTAANAILGAADVGFEVFRAAAETASVNLTVDGWDLTDLSSGSGGGSSTWSQSVTLGTGANVFSFVASDTSGASQTTTRTITLQTTGGTGGLPPDTDDGSLYETLHTQIYASTTAKVTSTSEASTVADTYSVVVDQTPPRLATFADDIQARGETINQNSAGQTGVVQIGFYNKGNGIPTSVTGLPEAWYAHTVARSNSTWGSTTRLHLPGSTAHWQAQPDGIGNWTDMTGAVGPVGHVYGSWKEYHAAEVQNVLDAQNATYAAADPYSTVFLDSLGSFIIQNQVDPANGTLYSSEPAVWYGLVNQAVSYIATHDTGDTIEANGVDSNPGLANVSDIAMIEGFMFSPGNTPATRLSPAAFITACNKAIAVQNAGAYVTILEKTWDTTGTSWASVTNAQLVEAAQWIRGAYHLVNQGKCLIEWSTQSSNSGAVKPWAANRTAYWIVDLSTPRDNQTSLAGYAVQQNVGTNGGTVYRRRFNRGVVYVNTGNQPVAVTLDRADYRELPSATLLTSPYTVPAQGAAILIADQDPAGTGAIRIQTAPAISGTEQVGQTLTTTNGVWSDGSQTITPTSIAYQWQVADDDGTGTGIILPWQDIAGATNKTYIPVAADEGKHLSSSITATDSGGNSATATSAATGAIAAASGLIPTVVARPVISPNTNSPQVGDVLTSTAGTFSGATSQTIRWQRGIVGSGSWTNITSATSTTYTVQSADIGFNLRTVATGTNSNGSVQSNSLGTLVVTGTVTAPQNITPPSITGNPVVGETLTGDPGQWSGDNLTFTYQWQRQ